jgi:phosphonate transport system substrate-binding protein
MRKRPIACILFVMCLPLFAACSRKEPPAPAKKPTATMLLIGLIPEQNLFRQVERYEPLGEYLFRKTGTKVTFKILPRYGNIIDSFKSSGLDGAFFGSFTYTLAHAKVGVEVMARPLALDNTSTYYGMIFVRKDSRIRTARDMKGKRFAFVDKATTAGYLLPLDYFHENGISNYRGYLREVYFTGTHEDAILDVLNRKADIGAAKSTEFQRLAKADPRIMKELVVLERSPDVPENALALRVDIDASVRDLLKDALLKMNLDPDGKKVLERFGALKFIETTDKDYDVVRKYAEDIHLNLATYEYMNNR